MEGDSLGVHVLSQAPALQVTAQQCPHEKSTRGRAQPADADDRVF